MSTKSLLPARLWPASRFGLMPGFDDLHRQVNRLFDDFTSEPRGSNGAMLAPKLDIDDDAKAITVSVELPGVDAKDVEVTVEGDTLTIRGEKTSDRKEPGNAGLVERSYGAFYRSVALPFVADPAQVSASSDKGVLTVVIPKPPEIQRSAKRIDVKPMH